MSLTTSQISELDYMFKKDAENKVKTDTSSTSISAVNEIISTATVVTGDNVWLASSILSQGPTEAVTQSVAVVRTSVKMYSVHGTGSSRSYPDLTGISWNTGIKDWIDPNIHIGFTPIFYIGGCNDPLPYTSTISKADPNYPFVFDYKSGILTFLNVPYAGNEKDLASVTGSDNHTLFNLAVDGWTYSGPTLPILEGGIAGQALVKTSSNAYDIAWSTLPKPVGLPSGGNSGQTLVKRSNTNYDVQWVTATSGGGGGSGGGVPLGGVQGQVLTKNSISAYDSSWSDPGLTWKDDFVANTSSLSITGEVYSYNNIAYASVTDTILTIDTPPNKVIFEYPSSSNGYNIDPAYKSTYQSLKIYTTDSANSRLNVLTKAPLSPISTRDYTTSILSTQSAGSYLNPTSVCFDEFSKIYLYILDSGNKAIKRIVITGPTTGTIDTITLIGGTLDGPKRIVINSIGTILYVSDANGANGSIKKIALSLSSIGHPIGTISTISTWAGSPVGLVLDAAEKYIYTCDSTKHTVSQILVASPNTRVSLAGVSGTSGNTDGYGTSGTFNGPTDIAIDYLGLLYVSDTGNDSIRTIKITSTAGITTTFTSNISNPAGISVDTFLNVYVASNGPPNQIIKISQSLSQTVLATGTTTLTGIYIPKVSDINFYYPICGTSTGLFINNIATYQKYFQFVNQPVLFPYVSQYIVEIEPIYFKVFDYVVVTNDLSVTIIMSESPGNMQVTNSVFNNRIVINASTVSVFIDNVLYSKFSYVDNPNFTKPSMTFGDSLRIYRVGSVVRVCVISGSTQLTMAKIDLSEINQSLSREFTFDVHYDVIPIFLNGYCQYSRFTMYKLPILERITDRVPDTTVYTSWHQTYSPTEDSSYTAGSIIQSNNSLYIRSNVPNTAILDRTLNSPIYESSFNGSSGFIVGTGNADGNGLSASFSSPNQISYDATSGKLYLLDATTIKTIDIASSSSNPPVVTRISSFNFFSIYDGKILNFFTGAMNTFHPFIRLNYALDTDYIVTTPAGFIDHEDYGNATSIVPDGQGNLFVTGLSLLFGKPSGSSYGDSGTYLIKYSIATDEITVIMNTFSGGYTNGPISVSNKLSPSFGLYPPASLAYDSVTNTIYASDPSNHSIRVFNSSGPSTSFTSLTTIAGSGISGYRDDVGRQVQFNNPQGIALDGLGNLYICDYDNKLIRKLNIASGLVSTVAGIYGSSGFIDGTVGTSTLSAPKSITFVPSSNLMYFTENESNLVRSLNIVTTEVRTVAGNITVLKDIYTLDNKTQKISNPLFATYSPNGILITPGNAGQIMGSLPYLTFPNGSILEYSVFGNSRSFLQIDASIGGYTYVTIGYNGGAYFDGLSTTVFPYSGGYTWQNNDTLRVIKQPYYIYVQYIRNNVVKNVLGFDIPIYNPAGFQQQTKFTMSAANGTTYIATSHLVEYPLPVWDLLLTDSSANVTDNFSIAVGTGTNNILYSANGLAWFPVSGTQFTISGSRVAWDGTLWFAVGSGTNRVIWSSNGTSWSTTGLVVPSTFTAGNDVASNGSLWIAVGTGTTPVIRSTNSLDWINVPVTGLTTGKTLAWNGSSWVLGGVGTTSSIYSSFDGVNWSAAASGAFSITCNGVATNGRLWIAVGSDVNSSTIAHSSNGSTWTKIGLFSNSGNGISWNGKMWIAVGSGSYPIFFSTTGTSWSRTGVTTFGSSSIGNSIAWNSNLWIATGTWYSSDNSSVLSSIITSPDGLVWTPVNGSPFTGNLATGCASRKPLPNNSNNVVSSKGIFVCNGTGTAQTLLNSTVTSTSNIMLTLATASPSVPSSLAFVSGITAGTGFSVTGVSGDLSTYNYIIL